MFRPTGERKKMADASGIMPLNLPGGSTLQ